MIRYQPMIILGLTGIVQEVNSTLLCKWQQDNIPRLLKAGVTITQRTKHPINVATTKSNYPMKLMKPIVNRYAFSRKASVWA